MAYTTLAKNNMLDNIGATHLALHSTYSNTGSSEITGTGYARKAITWSPAANASRAGTAPQFTIPVGQTVSYAGLWTALTNGVFLGMFPVGGAPQEFYADAANDLIVCQAHGFIGTDKIVFIGGSVPGGLTEAVEYYPVNITTDQFQVAATQSGVPIPLSSQGGNSVYVSRITPEVFTGGGTYSVTALTLGMGF